jgi:uncharacterized membrane protein YbhN (UPF0104 family)
LVPTLLKYGASLAILVILIYKYRGQFAEFYQTQIAYHWLGIALLTMLLAFLASYIRWRALAIAIGIDLDTATAIQLGFIGSFFNVVTIGVVGGDSLRAFYAARHSPQRIPEAILSVFIDRVIGLIAMCGFAAVAWIINGVPGEETVQKQAIEFGCAFAGVSSAMGCMFLMVLLFVPGLKHWPAVRWTLAIGKIGPVLERLMDAAALYSQRKRVIPFALLLSVTTNIMFSITIFLVGHAITQSPPTLYDHFVISPIAMVANSIPLPGGIGGMEAALAYLYSCFGSDGGLVVALGYRLCILWVSLIGWGVWLTTSGKLKTAATDFNSGQPKQNARPLSDENKD